MESHQPLPVFNTDPFYYEILWGGQGHLQIFLDGPGKPFPHDRKKVPALRFQQEEFGFGSVAMLQHDFSGQPLFVHNNLLKWHERISGKSFWKEIRRIPQHSTPPIKMKDYPVFGKYFLWIPGKGEVISQEHVVAQFENESLKELAPASTQ